MQMVGSANIVSWDEGDERGSSVRARLLQATQGIGCDRGGGAVAVAACLDTGVHALTPLVSSSYADPGRTYGGVGTPHLNVGISNRFAGRRVDDVDIQVRHSALLAGEEILADELTNDPYAASVHFMRCPARDRLQ